MTHIAIMQGYFLPYAGYFRLMCDVDAFVIVGSVQFSRHGWINRNRLRDHQGPLVLDTDLRLPAEISREERPFAICEQLSADTYVNAPGGQHLYEPDAFSRRGVKLEFLPLYRGDCASILQRLHDSSPSEVHAEIRRNLAP